jgi:hypothetical protein
MIKNYVPAECRTETRYDIVFDDGYGNGWCFPCDANGEFLDKTNECAYANYLEALKHPEKYVRYNKIVSQKYTVKDNAHGTCICGNEVELYDSYYGACQCEKCGRWYNIFGQELLPPDQWEHDPSEEEYWDY